MICTLYPVYSQIWLHLPRDDCHFFLHLPTDDNFGYKYNSKNNIGKHTLLWNKKVAKVFSPESCDLLQFCKKNLLKGIFYQKFSFFEKNHQKMIEILKIHQNSPKHEKVFKIFLFSIFWISSNLAIYSSNGQSPLEQHHKIEK